jgi:hypothetical protein
LKVFFIEEIEILKAVQWHQYGNMVLGQKDNGDG